MHALELLRPVLPATVAKSVRIQKSRQAQQGSPVAHSDKRSAVFWRVKLRQQPRSICGLLEEQDEGPSVARLLQAARAGAYERGQACTPVCS